LNEQTNNKDLNGIQPQEDTKQPPDGFRQPPDGFKMFSNMSIFLSRFMKLKNFQTNWNQSGFTSNKVEFKTKPETKLPQPNLRPAPDIVGEIVIGKGTGIHKITEDVFLKLNELGKNNRGNVNIERYTELLNEITQHPGNPATVELLGSLSKSNLFESSDDGEDLNTSLKNAFSESISSISDLAVKNNLAKKLDKISSKE
jgi:hypothetical protein